MSSKDKKKGSMNLLGLEFSICPFWEKARDRVRFSGVEIEREEKPEPLDEIPRVLKCLEKPRRELR